MRSRAEVSRLAQFPVATAVPAVPSSWPAHRMLSRTSQVTNQMFTEIPRIVRRAMDKAGLTSTQEIVPHYIHARGEHHTAIVA